MTGFKNRKAGMSWFHQCCVLLPLLTGILSTEEHQIINSNMWMTSELKIQTQEIVIHQIYQFSRE